MIHFFALAIPRLIKSVLCGDIFGLIGKQIYQGFWGFLSRIGTLFLLMLCLILSLGLHYLIIDYGVSASTLVYMVLLNTPGTLFVVIPFSAILSAILLMHRLDRQNELIIIRITGYNTWRIIQPVAMVGVMLACIGWINGLLIIPESTQTFNKLNREFRTQENEISIKPGRFNHFGDNIMLYARTATKENLYRDVIISIEKENGNNQILLARTGKFRNGLHQPSILLRHGSSQEFNAKSRSLQITEFNSYRLQVPEKEVNKISYWIKSNERYLPDLLFPDLDNPSDKARYAELVTKGHERLVTPVYFFLLPLIATLLMAHAPYERRYFFGKNISVTFYVFGIYILHRISLNMAASNLVFLVLTYGLLLLCAGALIVLLRRKTPLQMDLTLPLIALVRHLTQRMQGA